MDEKANAESQAGDGESYHPVLSMREAQQVISALGIKKANTKPWQLFLLAGLAGLYIALGGHVFLVAMEQGMGKVAGGAMFSVGLVLVVVAGAELFTGNVIMIVGAISRLFSVGLILRNWAIVYAGNFAGSLAVAFLIWHSGLLGAPGAANDLGAFSIRVAESKLALPFAEAFIRGVFCNILVVLAILMATMSRDIISKVACCVFPITVFVACGFEHCVANMYLIPAGLFASGASAADHMTVFGNLVPVTLGNVVGGLFILLIHPNRIRQLIVLSRQRRERLMAVRQQVKN